MARIKTIELQANGRKQTFEIAHAERLLKKANNGGWELPLKSKFIFTDNGIRPKQSKRANSESKKG